MTSAKRVCPTFSADMLAFLEAKYLFDIFHYENVGLPFVKCDYWRQNLVVFCSGAIFGLQGLLKLFVPTSTFRNRNIHLHCSFHYELINDRIISSLKYGLHKSHGYRNSCLGCFNGNLYIFPFTCGRRN